MDTSMSKTSPFPPASEIPLHRNPPLAPSQEMAYRNKCIQLKRRLTEIETNNDATRRRITNEKERIAKMRLLRAVLLNQLKEVMETPGRKLTAEQLKELGIREEVQSAPKPRGQGHEGLLDDSSDESEDEDLPEPGERPTRTRRTNNNYRESVMTNSHSNSHTQHQSPGLPHLAPANSFSPAETRNAPGLTSSFHVASTPLAADSPSYTHGAAPHYGNERYSQHSSPIQHHQTLYQNSPSNGVSSQALQPPVRPKPPVEQFHDHMRPQLVADNYPTDQIEDRIDIEWRKLSHENRGLWETRYEEQMMDYQDQMDDYQRARRREQAENANSGSGVVAAGSSTTTTTAGDRGGGGGGGSSSSRTSFMPLNSR